VSKAIYRFLVFPIKITMTFFRELHKSNLKILQKHQRSQTNKTNFKIAKLELSEHLISRPDTELWLSKCHGFGKKKK
jgi:hypothetical protein